MGFSFDPEEPSKTKILKKLSSKLFFFFNFLMTDHLIRNNLRIKELVVTLNLNKNCSLHCSTGISDQVNLAFFAFHYTCSNLKQEFIPKAAL